MIEHAVVADNLKEAFERFTVETSRLKETYERLKKQFNSVNIRLEATNRELHTKVLELANTKECLNTILANISQGILFISNDGIVMACNAAAEKILGRSSITGKTFSEIFEDTIFGFSMQAVLTTRMHDFSPFIRYCTPSGICKDLEITATSVSADIEKHSGAITVIRDITEVRKLRSLANRHDRLHELGEMAASIAHEIRNPLGGIEGFASLLCRDLKEKPDQQKMANAIVDGARSLNKLVSTVLGYARPLKMSFEKVSLKKLMEDVCALFSADKALSAHVSFVTEIPSDIEAYIDTASIKSALMNISLNAAQAMERGGTVRMMLSEADGHAIIDIKDTGCGIPPENIEKIFSPFFTTKQEGTGFGLSDAYKTLRAHGGTIDVSSSPGNTLFTLKIPLLEEAHTKEILWR